MDSYCTLLISLVGLALTFGLFRALGGYGAPKRIDLSGPANRQKILLRGGVVALIFLILAGSIVAQNVRGGSLDARGIQGSVLIVIFAVLVNIIFRLRGRR